jgi:hypothetical protein
VEICTREGWQEGWWRLQVDSHILEDYKENWKSIEEALKEQNNDTIEADSLTVTMDSNL